MIILVKCLDSVFRFDKVINLTTSYRITNSDPIPIVSATLEQNKGDNVVRLDGVSIDDIMKRVNKAISQGGDGVIVVDLSDICKKA